MIIVFARIWAGTIGITPQEDKISIDVNPIQFQVKLFGSAHFFVVVIGVLPPQATLFDLCNVSAIGIDKKYEMNFSVM